MGFVQNVNAATKVVAHATKEKSMSEEINDMVGRTFTSVENKGDELIFHSEEKSFKFYHSQDCCESVRIEDIVGDLEDLVNTPILGAEEISGVGDPEPEYADSYTWTYYKFRTIKGYVDVRWLGESNGYYSESVDLSVKEKDGDWSHRW